MSLAFASLPAVGPAEPWNHGEISRPAKQGFGTRKVTTFPVTLTSTVAMFAALRGRRSSNKGSRLPRNESRPAGSPATSSPVKSYQELTTSPAETYKMLVQDSVHLKNQSWLKTLVASTMGGAYVGLACLLSFALGGTMFNQPTAQMAAFAMLFPVNLLFILSSGGQLFTGNSATMAMGLLEKKVTMKDLVKNWSIAYAGNMLGCLLIGLVANYSGVLTASASNMIVANVTKKCSGAFGPTLVKGVMCNWLVCLAVWLCTMAKGLGGKMIGAWFPISMFVAIGFEHSVTNMFLLPTGLLAGAPVSIFDMLMKNLIPVTIGNAIAGALVVAVSMSFSFGRLGKQRS